MIKVSAKKPGRGKVWDCNGKSKIVKIFISHGNIIHSIQFMYASDSGDLDLSERYGGDRGDNLDTVTLDYPNEFLTSVKGGRNCSTLTSIVFTTNLRTFGPFGSRKRDSTKFNFELGQDDSFGGFHGTTSKIGLESIGIYIKPFTGEVVRKINSARRDQRGR
ncbi:hypothetical protein NMG60_11024995 [Bertholletia excelsa]